MKPIIALALSKFDRKLSRQPWDIIAFSESHLELRSFTEPASNKRIEYQALTTLTFISAKSGVSKWLEALGGIPFRRFEDELVISTEQLDLRLNLEVSTQYNPGELTSLFRMLYLKSIPFREETRNGIQLFLLRKIPNESISQKVEALRKASE